MSAVGIDSIKAELGNAPNIFEGLLGIAVTCKEEAKFNELYQKCLPEALKILGITTDRKVLKAYDISKLAPEQEDKIIQPLLDGLNEQIERIDIYYTRYNANKLPSITIYGKDQPTTKKPVEFLRLISNAYPHYVGYFYFNEYTSAKITNMYLDHFESCRTPCWEDLSRFEGLKIIYKGGNCNCLVAVADILLRISIMGLKTRRETFNGEGLARVHSQFTWSKKVCTHELGGSTTILRAMTPINRRQIDLTNHLSRPLVFVPTEGLAGVLVKDERDMFEELPIFDALANFLFRINGTFKYFKPDSDVKIIRRGDYFLVVGPNSETMFKYLKACGATLTMLTPDDLKEKKS
jgi:hypothetical protein